MGRTKGSKNKNSAALSFIDLSLEERLTIVANLVVDKVMEDQAKGRPLLKKIEAKKC